MAELQSATTEPAASRRIAVIGAGPLGLACAYDLARAGCAVTVFEADPEMGGQSASLQLGSLTVERYYHFICRTDQALFALLDELGLTTTLRWADTRMAFFHQGRLYPFGDPLSLLKFTPLSLLSRLRYGLHAWYCTKLHDLSTLDKQYAVPWLKKCLGDEAYHLLWENLLTLKFHEFATEVSASWLAARIRRQGRSRRSLFHESLGYLTGGTKSLLDALCAAISAHGGVIKLSSPVSSITCAADGTTGRYQISSEGTEQTFEAVISTIPLPQVPQLFTCLSPEQLEPYRFQENLGVVCVIQKLRRPLSYAFYLNLSAPDFKLPGLIEYTNLNPLDGSHLVYAPFYLPRTHQLYSAPDAELIALTRRCLKTVNPELAERDFLDCAVSRYPYAQPLCRPGHRQSLPPLSPLPGLYIADTAFYGPEDRSLTESIASGRSLAKAALTDLGATVAPGADKGLTPPHQDNYYHSQEDLQRGFTCQNSGGRVT